MIFTKRTLTAYLWQEKWHKFLFPFPCSLSSSYPHNSVTVSMSFTSTRDTKKVLPWYITNLFVLPIGILTYLGILLHEIISPVKVLKLFDILVVILSTGCFFAMITFSIIIAFHGRDISYGFTEAKKLDNVYKMHKRK